MKHQNFNPDEWGCVHEGLSAPHTSYYKWHPRYPKIAITARDCSISPPTANSLLVELRNAIKQAQYDFGDGFRNKRLKVRPEIFQAEVLDFHPDVCLFYFVYWQATPQDDATAILKVNAYTLRADDVFSDLPIDTVAQKATFVGHFSYQQLAAVTLEDDEMQQVLKRLLAPYRIQEYDDESDVGSRGE